MARSHGRTLTMAEILATQALAKRFGGVVATDNVTLSVMSGELRCIIGPNGAGKSTLFALLCGIHRPDAGSILLKGQDVTRLSAFRRVRLGVGLTFQTNRAYHHLTVRQNLEVPMRPAGQGHAKDALERYGHALEMFGLDPMSDVRAGELPHDKLQWLEIAMVLAGGPEILLLDEPTAGLSPEETRNRSSRSAQNLSRASLTMANVLMVNELRAGYATGDVLQGVSINVAPGEVVGVLGRNGVGKSTLMKAVIGLLPVRSGSLSFKGDDVTRESANRRARRGMGYVPQGREIFPHMSVHDNLQMGQFVNRRQGHFNLDEVYGWFPFLKNRSRQRGGTLSGGQQEMLAIARALVNGPELLLLDEPSDGVQPSIIEEIGGFITELVQRQPLGVLIVEQNINLLQTVAQRAYVMEKGRVVAVLDRRELGDTERVASFLAI
jgi:urea ABC transporter ATP-binding protein UrtE